MSYTGEISLGFKQIFWSVDCLSLLQHRTWLTTGLPWPGLLLLQEQICIFKVFILIPDIVKKIDKTDFETNSKSPFEDVPYFPHIYL